jgi:hypothetical protein
MQAEKTPDVVEVTTGTLHTGNLKQALTGLTLDAKLTSLYSKPSEPYRK